MGLKRVLGAFIMAVAMIALAGLKPVSACDTICFSAEDCSLAFESGTTCTVEVGPNWVMCSQYSCEDGGGSGGDPNPKRPHSHANLPTTIDARLTLANMTADEVEAYCKTQPGCMFSRIVKPVRSVWARGLMAKAVR